MVPCGEQYSEDVRVLGRLPSEEDRSKAAAEPCMPEAVTWPLNFLESDPIAVANN